jgi:uncharacterized protein RhaS with RHS repeats
MDVTQVTVTDPVAHKTGVKVDDNGRVYLSTSLAGKRVNVVVEEEHRLASAEPRTQPTEDDA